jgi:hypothetical protein
MFGRKKWQTKILIEGEKSAQLVSRIEKLPDVNPDYEYYPVELKLPEKTTFKEAIKKAVEYAKHNIYTMFYKVKA